MRANRTSARPAQSNATLTEQLRLTLHNCYYACPALDANAPGFKGNEFISLRLFHSPRVVKSYTLSRVSGYLFLKRPAEKVGRNYKLSPGVDYWWMEINETAPAAFKKSRPENYTFMIGI
jgi:hypothetical protein